MEPPVEIRNHFAVSNAGEMLKFVMGPKVTSSPLSLEQSDRPPSSESASNFVPSAIAMTTKVQVRDETRRVLDRLKRELGLNSYDKVISRLVTRKIGVPESLIGAARGSKPFTRESEDEHRL